MHRDKVQAAERELAAHICSCLNQAGLNPEAVPHRVESKARHGPNHRITWYLVWVLGEGKRAKRFQAHTLTADKIALHFRKALDARQQDALKTPSNRELEDLLSDATTLLGARPYCRREQGEVVLTFRVREANARETLRLLGSL